VAYGDGVTTVSSGEPVRAQQQQSTRDPVMTLRVQQPVQDYLTARARELGVTRSELVRDALQQVTPAELWHEPLNAAHPGAGESPGGDAAPHLRQAGAADDAG
jgi:hypothetical protein